MAKTVNHGHALYFEMHSTDGQNSIAQFIIVGETIHQGKIVPSRMYARTINPEHPQVKWRPDYNSLSEISSIAPSGTFLRTATPGVAIDQAHQLWKKLVGTVDATAAAQFKLYAEPFVVQVSELDIIDLASYATPKKLIDRIRNGRIERNWVSLPSAASPKTAVI